MIRVFLAAVFMSFVLATPAKAETLTVTSELFTMLQQLFSALTQGGYNINVTNEQIVIDDGNTPFVISGSSGVPDYSDKDWIYCAKQGDTCRINGLFHTIYGNNNGWAVRDQSKDFLCSKKSYRTDPRRGEDKYCFIKAVQNEQIVKTTLQNCISGGYTNINSQMNGCYTPADVPDPDPDPDPETCPEGYTGTPPNCVAPEPEPGQQTLSGTNNAMTGTSNDGQVAGDSLLLAGQNAVVAPDTNQAPIYKTITLGGQNIRVAATSDADDVFQEVVDTTPPPVTCTLPEVRDPATNTCGVPELNCTPPEVENEDGTACVAPEEPDMGGNNGNYPSYVGYHSYIEEVIPLPSSWQPPTPSQFANGGQFRIWVNTSHYNNDDMLVYPGQQGASHTHVYFGNSNANYASTPSSIANSGGSTASGGIANRSGYWVPSLVNGEGVHQIPKVNIVYYKTGNAAAVTTPPSGLRMIAYAYAAPTPQGAATSAGNWNAHGRWTCNSDYNTRQYHIPNCGGGSTVDLFLVFPECWDGVNLYKTDQSHMAHPTNGVCPPGYPVRIPEITYNVHWDVPAGDNTNDWKLVSDMYDTNANKGGFSMHGDWVNGWNQDIFAEMVNGCLKANLDCHADTISSTRALRRLPAQ